MKRKIYVASSWRNDNQPIVVTQLRAAGHEVYDFRDDGFHWSEIDGNWAYWTREEMKIGLGHRLAEEGFKADFAAMQWADTCVYVLPCGRSASFEAGWFVGQEKLSIALLDDGEPEIMFKAFDYLCIGMQEVLEVL